MIVDICACGCKGVISSGEVCYEYDVYRFKHKSCVADYVGAKEVIAQPYKESEKE